MSEFLCTIIHLLGWLSFDNKHCHCTKSTGYIYSCKICEVTDAEENVPDRVRHWQEMGWDDS